MTEEMPIEDRMAIREMLKQWCERFGAKAIQEALDDIAEGIEQDTRDIESE